MPAKAQVISAEELLKLVDEALRRALKIEIKKPSGPITMGRLIKNAEGNPATLARKVTAEVAPKLPGLKATPTTIPGKDGTTTIGFVLRAPIGK